MESKVGIELFLVQCPGVGGRLKKYPEDFVVKEEIDLTKWEGEGEYVIAKVWSRNWETNRLIRHLSRELHISRRNIRFAGTKDKRAVTTQWMSFKVEPEELLKINIKDVEISDIRSTPRSLYIGSHLGNWFDIIVRDLETDDASSISDKVGSHIKKLNGFPNWFGVQRFGTMRPITHLVGKAIVKGDFQKAVRTYVANPIEEEEENSYRVRKKLESDWDYQHALKTYPRYLNFERAILQELVKNPEDHVSALRVLPDNLLSMFVHAYQSYIFNKILSKRLHKGLPLNDVVAGDVVLPADREGYPVLANAVKLKDRNLNKASRMVKEGKAYVSAPLFGIDSELSDGEPGEIEAKIIEKEGLNNDDFVIPEIRKLSSRGSRRSIFSPIKGLKWEVDTGVLRTSFYLQKGSYATCLLREFMKLPDDKVNRYS
ncbi:MAG: tRNA pseudouridine(13) synthase TruD [Thermoplasmata archaeon]